MVSSLTITVRKLTIVSIPFVCLTSNIDIANSSLKAGKILPGLVDGIGILFDWLIVFYFLIFTF
jgi:hypothetical protein